MHLRYCLPNHALFSIAEQMPTELSKLKTAMQPVPRLVRERGAELVAVIVEAIKQANAAPPVPFIPKPNPFSMPTDGDVAMDVTISERPKVDLWTLTSGQWIL